MLINILQVRNLKAEEDVKKKVSILQEIGKKYFQPESALVLENTELWQRCAKTCASVSYDTCSEAEKWVVKAHDSVLTELDNLHLLFLQQRRQQSCVDKILCIL